MTDRRALPFEDEAIYRVLEKALATIHSVPAPIQGKAFRAAISNLQKTDILGDDVRVGPGRRVTYTVPHMERWFLALELAEFDIGTSAVVEIIKRHWETAIGPIFRAAQRTVIHDADDSDVVMVIRGLRMMAAKWSGDAMDEIEISRTTIGELRQGADKIVKRLEDTRRPGGPILLNLSGRLRALHSALADANMEELREQERYRARLKAKTPQKRATLP
jgi:hypothetical protein